MTKKYLIIPIVLGLLAGSLLITKEYLLAASRGTTGQLVGWWTLDKNDINGTRILDKSGNNNNGTSFSSPTLVPGKVNEALSFTPSQVIQAGNQESLRPGTGSFTACAWLYPYTTGTTYYVITKCTGGAASTDTGWFLNWAQSGSRWQFIVTDPGHSAAALDPGARTPNQWYHVCGTFNSSKTASLYVDGKFITSATTATLGDINTNSVFTIAGINGAANWNGKIDDVRYYNYALSAQEIGNLYQSSKVSYTPAASRTGLVGWWTMDQNDASATRVLDKSGGSSHGTPYGFYAGQAPTSTAGKINQAINFDGKNGYIDIGTTQYIKTTSPFTVSAWVKRTGYTSADGSNYPIILSSKTNQTENWRLLLSDNAGYSDVSFGSNANFSKLHGGTIPVNTWKHISVTYNGNGATTDSNYILYIDGVSTATSTGQPFASQTGNGSIASNLTAQQLLGSIDDVRIYNYALSAQEVANLYSAKKTTYSRSATRTGLIGHWSMDLDDINGVNVLDKSGKNNTGVGTNITSADSASGKINQAFDFDGSTEYIAVPDNDIYETAGAKTVSLWVKTTGTGQPISKYRSDTVEDGWQIVLSGLTTSYGNIKNSEGTSFSCGSGGLLQAGEWNHIVMTWNTDGSTYARYYTNGVFRGQSTNPLTGTFSGNALQVNIGRGLSGGLASTQMVDGLIDDVRIYNRVLSDQEVAGIYNAAKINHK